MNDDLVIGGPGAQQLEVLAKRLKATGDRELRKELLRAFREGTKGTKPEVTRSLASRLPQRGGLAARMATSRVSTKTKLSGRTVGVRIEARSPHDIRGMNAGRLRHKVFGRNQWVDQTIEPGVFTEPIEHDAPEIRDALQRVMRDLAHRLERN